MASLFRKIVGNYCQQVRYAPRWTHRRPAKVILPEEYDSKNDSVVEPLKQKNIEKERDDSISFLKINWKQPSKKNDNKDFKESSVKQHKIPKAGKPLTITQKVNKLATKPKSVDMLETTIDKEGNFVYTKMQNNDIRISKIMAEVKLRKEKEKSGLMLLEGKILIREALEAGCKLEYILFSRMKEIDYLKPYLPKLGAKLFKMPYKEIQTWSDLTTTPGIMGLFKIPATDSFTSNDVIPLTVICDNIREPNNLGAILRTCSGVGCQKIILTKGCVDVWETKVLRSACGAHFKLHISKKPDWNEIRSQLPENSTIFIADNNIVSSKNISGNLLEPLVSNVPLLPYFGVDFKSPKHVVLIIGGETDGISEESYRLVKDFNGARLNVPLSNGVDSLNAATALGIIVFEVKRQLSSLSDGGLEDYKSRIMSINT